MSDPFMDEIERQVREAKAEDEGEAFKYNPQVGVDPETGGVMVEVDLPDSPTDDQVVEAMEEAARKAGLL